MIPIEILKKAHRKKIINKDIRRVFTTPELLKKIVIDNENDGFIWDKENSQLDPCGKCGFMELYFIEK